MTQPRLVGGRYELGDLIGYGGMAEVHRGRDSRLNREVAIKVLRADLARDPSFLTRFRREAHSAAGLNHPSIVAVYDTGEDVAPDGTAVPFIVMEYVEGRTLRDVLRAEGTLPGPRAMEIVADICNALEFSHRNGIIHRDIKPANVMITPAGAVKVMDFGIARAVADTSATVTQTANVIGTAQYLSPEQARGEAVDARSDVYSTGCLLYELVTGVPPFQGDSPVAVAYQHVRENPVLPSARNPQVPRAVDSIVMKALAKNPQNRYQSAGDMRTDLQRALAGQAVQAETVMTDDERTQFIARTPPVVPVRHDRWDDEEDHRRTGLIWAAVVVALLLVIGFGTWLIVGTGGNEKKNVTIGSVIGFTKQAAVENLRNQGLKPQFAGTTPEACKDEDGATVTVGEGQVCLTSPAPGAQVVEGSVVRYYTFQQKLSVVPFVEGQSLAKAVEQLKAADLTYKKVYRYSAEDKDTVLEQGTSANQTVKPGTSITLYLSSGTLQLPDLVGKPLTEAEDLIPDDFGKPVIRERTTRDESKNGIVAGQDPEKGAYKPSRKITLTVYRYSPPPPTCTPAPTATPSSPAPPASSSASPSPGTSSLPVCPTPTPSSGAPSS